MGITLPTGMRARLAVVVAALAVFVLALPLWAGLMLRERIVTEAEREIATKADVAAVAVERRLQALRYALSGLPVWLDGPALEGGMFDAEVHLALQKLHAIGQQGLGFIVIAPSGRFVASAIGIDTPGAPSNALDRPNIATLGEMTPSGLTISAPYRAVAAHIAGRPALAISRSLPSGGWVQAIVHLDLGLGLLPATDLGAGSQVWLLREDGQAVATWPPPIAIPAPRFDAAAMQARPMAGAVTLPGKAVDPFDEAAAIKAWRALPEFGLVLVVHRELSAVLAPWWVGMATILSAFGLALAAVAVLAWQATRTAAALSRSEDRAAMVANAMGLLLWSRPHYAAIPTHHNRGAEKLTGYSTEELTARPGVWRERVIHPDDRPQVALEVAGAARPSELHQTYRIIRKDGAVRWVEQRVRFMADGSLFGVVHDITPLKETQERLARREAELAEAMRISGLGNWRYEPATGAFSLSESICDQFGVDETSFNPTLENITALIVPEDRHVVGAAFARATETGEHVEFEYRLRRPDGTIRHRWARAAPETTGQGPTGAIVGVCQDVTERREAAAQLAQASRMAALGQFTGGIAHDVNNMLTVVSLNLDLLADEVTPGTLGAEALGAARSAAAGGAELTAQLLAFARRQPLNPAAVAVGPLFAELAPLLSRSLGQNVRPVLSVAPDTPAVLADAAQLRSALLNLAINARDAMPEGGTLRITAAPAKEEGFVAFAVADDGTGMPAEVAARAFEPFFTTKPSGKGTGLGLSQVYGFVTQSQGTIAIDSAAGAGTVVRFTLPVAVTAAGTEAAARPGPGRGLRVLVVEDEVALRVAIVAMCRSAGLVVSEAENAAAAMAQIEAGLVPDLLFTDVTLGPGPDGVTLAMLVRRRLPGVRVLFATGFTAEAEVPEGAALLRKPYAREALLAAIAEVLADEKASAPLPA
ncbi:MAG: PAS domain-containing protein [Acetobacteraceae bacterium]|nr:PAS domain-containing protein [Acetobacteraceae bacterium]